MFICNICNHHHYLLNVELINVIDLPAITIIERNMQTSTTPNDNAASINLGANIFHTIKCRLKNMAKNMAERVTTD